MPDTKATIRKKSPARKKAAAPRDRLRRALAPVLMSGAAVLAVFLTWSIGIASYETVWTVKEHRWVRTVETVINQPIRGEGWDLPEKAKILHTEIRLRPQPAITGNEEGVITPASATRETAHARWYEWESPNWVPDEDWTASGSGIRRSWPDLPPVGRTLRETGRTETLWLVLVGADEARDWRVQEKDWLRMRDGTRIVTETDFWGRVRTVRDEHGKEIDFRP